MHNFFFKVAIPLQLIRCNHSTFINIHHHFINLTLFVSSKKHEYFNKIRQFVILHIQQVYRSTCEICFRYIKINNKLTLLNFNTILRVKNLICRPKYRWNYEGSKFHIYYSWILKKKKNCWNINTKSVVPVQTMKI